MANKDYVEAMRFYQKHPYKVETRILNPATGKYRTTEEFFKTEKQARKKYESLLRLHDPEWLVSLDLYKGIYWLVLDRNTARHHVWRFDEYGIESKVFNLDKLRESITA